MIGSATSGAFDVLVVGYVSRFLRNLKQTLIAVEDHLHTAGVVVLFADERLLSSDPGSWDQFIREAHEAEAYSRRLGKRIREGYAAKRRRLGVPGGSKAPLGTVRQGRMIEVDEAEMAVVRRVYELAAAGRTDREVGAATGLALDAGGPLDTLGLAFDTLLTVNASSALLALLTFDALCALLALSHLDTIGALRARLALDALLSLHTGRARLTLYSLRALGSRRGLPLHALGTLRALAAATLGLSRLATAFAIRLGPRRG